MEEIGGWKVSRLGWNYAEWIYWKQIDLVFEDNVGNNNLLYYATSKKFLVIADRQHNLLPETNAKKGRLVDWVDYGKTCGGKSHYYRNHKT